MKVERQKVEYVIKKVEHFMNRFVLYFFRGILLIAPLGATFYLISRILKKIYTLTSFGTNFGIPGLGMVITIFSITLITLLGYIGSTLLIQSVFNFTESFIKKIPFISILYSSLKDFTSAFVSSKGKFDRPVLVTMDKTENIYRIGFITKESLENFSLPNHLAVYLPNSYDLAGILILVPHDLVHPLDLPSADVMKFIFSGAVTELKDIPCNKVHTHHEA